MFAFKKNLMYHSLSAVLGPPLAADLVDLSQCCCQHWLRVLILFIHFSCIIICLICKSRKIYRSTFKTSFNEYSVIVEEIFYKIYTLHQCLLSIFDFYYYFLVRCSWIMWCSLQSSWHYYKETQIKLWKELFSSKQLGN